jgi:hypothetical protein
MAVFTLYPSSATLLTICPCDIASASSKLHDRELAEALSTANHPRRDETHVV